VLARASFVSGPSDDGSTAPPKSEAPTPTDGPASDRATRSAAGEAIIGESATDHGLERVDEIVELPDEGPVVENDPERDEAEGSLPEVDARLDGNPGAERGVGKLGPLVDGLGSR
jgi:hypothetical protein